MVRTRLAFPHHWTLQTFNCSSSALASPLHAVAHGTRTGRSLHALGVALDTLDNSSPCSTWPSTVQESQQHRQQVLGNFFEWTHRHKQYQLPSFLLPQLALTASSYNNERVYSPAVSSFHLRNCRVWQQEDSQSRPLHVLWPGDTWTSRCFQVWGIPAKHSYPLGTVLIVFYQMTESRERLLNQQAISSKTQSALIIFSAIKNLPEYPTTSLPSTFH